MPGPNATKAAPALADGDPRDACRLGGATASRHNEIQTAAQLLADSSTLDDWRDDWARRARRVQLCLELDVSIATATIDGLISEASAIERCMARLAELVPGCLDDERAAA